MCVVTNGIAETQRRIAKTQRPNSLISSLFALTLHPTLLGYWRLLVEEIRNKGLYPTAEDYRQAYLAYCIRAHEGEDTVFNSVCSAYNHVANKYYEAFKAFKEGAFAIAQDADKMAQEVDEAVEKAMNNYRPRLGRAQKD